MQELATNRKTVPYPKASADLRDHSENYPEREHMSFCHAKSSPLSGKSIIVSTAFSLVLLRRMSRMLRRPTSLSDRSESVSTCLNNSARSHCKEWWKLTHPSRTSNC